MENRGYWEQTVEGKHVIHELKIPLKRTRHETTDRVPITISVNTTSGIASVENINLPHPLGNVSVYGLFENGKITQIGPIGKYKKLSSTWDAVKVRLGGKALLLRHLRKVLDAYPNPELRKTLGLTKSTNTRPDMEEYHAGQVDETPKSPWQPEVDIKGAHIYNVSELGLKTIHAGDYLDAQGDVYLPHYDISIPLRFRLNRTGEITGTELTMQSLFHAKTDKQLIESSAHLRSLLRKAFESHPHAAEFKHAIAKF